MDETRTASFTSTVVMGKAEHAEFSSVSYQKIQRLLMVYAILSALFTVFFDQPTAYPLKISGCLFALSLLVYLVYAMQGRQRWKQRAVSEGKDSTTFTVHFGEKITVETDQHAPVDFDYAAITSLKETEHYYLLGMKPRLYIVVDKTAAGSTDFLSYLLEKCPNMKGRKPQRIINVQRTCLICLSLHGALVLFNLIRHLM
ncbi:MAG: hypothetical protein IKK21_11290 [Clostridia bacterium]|nr:hypothetical protein [Clostridia bacterium]